MAKRKIETAEARPETVTDKTVTATASKLFQDKYTKKVYQKGDTFEVTAKRLEELKAAGVVEE